jgi:hypothetical protein
MSIIIATWEAKIWRIAVPGQLGQKKKKKSLHPNGKKLGMMAHACHPSYSGQYKIEESRFRLAWTKSETLSPK